MPGVKMSGIDRLRRPVLYTLIGLLIVGAGVLALRWPRPAGVEVILPPATATPAGASTPAPIRVYVCGAVQRPDVYQLPLHSIVKDAVEAAGGATAEADLNRINLAQELVDQAKVLVPSVHDLEDEDLVSTPAFTGGRSSSLSNTMGIDLNSATTEELDTLPGIGPVLAQRIIENRPYRNVEDLLQVPGIGPATFQKLRDKISVR